MDDFALQTREIRVLESAELSLPIEVEFSSHALLTTQLSQTWGEPVTEEDLAPQQILQFVARMALTSSPIPPIAISKGGPDVIRTQTLGRGIAQSR